MYGMTGKRKKIWSIACALTHSEVIIVQNLLLENILTHQNTKIHVTREWVDQMEHLSCKLEGRLRARKEGLV